MKNTLPSSWPYIPGVKGTGDLLPALSSSWYAYVFVVVILLILATMAAAVMNVDLKRFVSALTVLFMFAFLVLILGSE